MPFELKTITVFAAIDKDGDEGVMGAQIGNVFYPLVCGDEERIASLFPYAEQIKEMTGKDYKVYQFTSKNDVTANTISKYKN